MYKYVLIDLDDSTFKYLKTKQDVIKIAKFIKRVSLGNTGLKSREE